MNRAVIESFRRLVPATRNTVYLNHAALSPLPDPVAETMQEVIADFSRHGATHFGEWQKRLREGRSVLARFVGADPEEIAFVRNTSEGVTIAAFGIDWRQGDNVVLVDQEFPANVLPWLHAAGRFQVSPRFVSPQPDGRIRISDLAAQIDQRTRVVAISFVQFASGYRFDLDKIGELCRERGVLLFVDGIQGVGVLPLDVRRTAVDMLACGGYKWLLGPVGSGFLFVRKGVLESLQPVVESWTSVEEPYDMLTGATERVDYTKPLARTAERFHGGALNVLGFVGLAAAVALLAEVGIEGICRRVLELGDRLIEGVRGKGYEILSPLEPGSRSGIVVIRPGEADPRQLFRHLHQQGFRLALPCGNLRLSPHFYNTEEEIDRFVGALP